MSKLMSKHTVALFTKITVRMIKDMFGDPLELLFQDGLKIKTNKQSKQLNI